MTNRIPPEVAAGRPSGRKRPKHPARRTRRGLGIGAAIATIGLTGAYWSSELGGATSAAGSSSSDDSSSVSSSSSDTSSSYEDDYDSYGEDFDSSDDTSSSVAVAPSAAAPNTSSGAS